MTLAENKALVRRFVDQVFVEGRREAVDELLADDFVSHTWRFTGDGMPPRMRVVGGCHGTSPGPGDASPQRHRLRAPTPRKSKPRVAYAVSRFVSIRASTGTFAST